MVNPQQPVRVRPGVVTISSYLLISYAVLALIDMVIGLTTLGTVREIYRDAYAGTENEGTEGVVVFVFVAMSMVRLLFAAGLVVLALLNNRGMNTARIITWVVGGIALCCTGVGLALSAAGSAVGGETSDDVASQGEIDRRLAEALPSWYEPVLTLTATLGVIAVLVALILLALPKSNEFFRKPQQQWEPPVPGTAYPMAPGGPVYPAAPGASYPMTPGASYPTGPGQPGYPQADPGSGEPGQSGSSGGDWSSGSSGGGWSSGSSGNSGSSDSGGGGHSSSGGGGYSGG